MVHLVVYVIIAGSVMINSVAASDLYKKGSKGSNSCPKGYGHISTHVECKKAGDALDTSLHRTPIGSWSHVPPYCSYQSGFTHGKAGDRSVHFNKKHSGKNDGGYTPICKRQSDFYKKGSKGSNSCPKGYGHISTHAECKKAGDALDTSLHRTPIGSWGHIPPYCSYQSGYTKGKAGDRSVHFNKKPYGKNDGGYTPICKRQEECLPLPLPVQQAHVKDYPGRIVCYRGGSACTAEKPCGPYEGDCDSDDECAGDLVCDADKIDGKLTGGSAPDICKPLGLDRCTGLQPCFFGEDACTKEKPCSAYVGDCDSDDQCAGDLVCVKGPQADFCQPKGTPEPRGKKAAFTKGFKECKAYEYDTGKCTACPGYWYQSCPTKTFEHYGVKTTGRGYESGQKYCGFLSCKVKCTIKTIDYGCGCNQAQPVDGWCLDVVLNEIYYPKNSGLKLRRRAESPVLENLLAEIEEQSDGNDEAGDEKTRVVE